uniref:Integrase catalytic domain-containing protein n=1 Tax=Oryzias latipes TaxID=8090 RepID=H2M3Q2_ORYLA
MPDRPWQRLGADLFTLDSKEYLLVVDYFSRFVEIAQLSYTRSMDVVVHLKSIFARHGIPQVLVTDNGPQFSGSHFQAFAACYGFEHVTSSPRFPQSNGEAERAVQTVKRLLKKSSDPYRALLAYRATPLQNGYSPAELLMGRRLRTTVPALPSLLDPALPDYHTLGAKEREKRWRDARTFDKRHKARNLEPLVPGQEVWITDARAQGTVISAHEAPRSYRIKVPQGTLRRNRHHLVSMQTDGEGVEPVDEPVGEDTLTPTVRTRSGRVVRKPDRLNL